MVRKLAIPFRQVKQPFGEKWGQSPQFPNSIPDFVGKPSFPNSGIVVTVPIFYTYVMWAALVFYLAFQQISVPSAADLRSCPKAAAAFRSGQFEQTVEAAQNCIQKGLESAETYKTLALACYMLQRTEDFQKYMGKAIGLNPRDGAPHYHLGRFHYENKRYREAMEDFRRALELDPDNYKAHYYSGLCRQGNNDEDGAITDYRKAIEIIEKNRVRYGWPFADLADLLVLRGELDRGISWSYRATRNDPILPYTHYVYAAALMKREASFEVEQALTRAIQLDPGYTQAHYLLGRYYTKIGEKEKAQAAFAKFEELRKSPQLSPFGLRR